MTPLAWVFAALTAVFALTDWWAVVVGRVTVRYVAKPATLVALIGVAVTLDPADPRVRTWMVLGLVLSLAGDIFLMLDEKFFIAGLVSFLLGHVAYVVGLQLAPTSAVGTLVGIAVVIAGVAVVGRRIVQGVGRGTHPEMVGPVIAYLAVISAMVVSAFGTGDPRAIAGASLFYASDATLAWNRFLEPHRWGSLAVMITYHLGQFGLVAWLV